jgi:hypothetical protein
MSRTSPVHEVPMSVKTKLEVDNYIGLKAAELHSERAKLLTKLN